MILINLIQFLYLVYTKIENQVSVQSPNAIASQTESEGTIEESEIASRPDAEAEDQVSGESVGSTSSETERNIDQESKNSNAPDTGCPHRFHKFFNSPVAVALIILVCVILIIFAVYYFCCVMEYQNLSAQTFRSQHHDDFDRYYITYRRGYGSYYYDQNNCDANKDEKMINRVISKVPEQPDINVKDSLIYAFLDEHGPVEIQSIPKTPLNNSKF